ncbi:MAG: hypothetical protein WBL23_17265, partial [Salinisphaera sp.]|uniref:hypothetical protein n=1 Tax=Salinisphaera sp. TaxID=1914330 RepID=UPI003C7DF0E3
MTATDEGRRPPVESARPLRRGRSMHALAQASPGGAQLHRDAAFAHTPRETGAGRPSAHGAARFQRRPQINGASVSHEPIAAP